MPGSVTILPHTNGLEPSTSVRMVASVRAHPLSSIPDLKTQQGLIIQDLLFALLGYEGSYIRYSEKYDPQQQEHRLQGPDFKIAKHLDMSLKGVTKKLVRYGKYYAGLIGFVEVYNQPEFGKVAQRLCHEIQRFCQEYYELVVAIEHQYRSSGLFNLNILESTVDQRAGQITHLYDIASEIHQETLRRQSTPDLDFSNFIESIQNDFGTIDYLVDTNKFRVCKGGLILMTVQSRIAAYKGDSVLLEFLTGLFNAIGEDYVAMLNKWLMEGVVDDPFDEFVIRKNNLSDLLLVSSEEKYWEDLFLVRIDGLIDQFKSKEIQQKLILTGKFLKIFQKLTGLENFDNLREVLVPIESLYTHNFELKIDQFYQRASKLLLKLLLEGFNLNGLLSDLQVSYLLCNGSYINDFLDVSFTELRRNKYNVLTNRLERNYAKAQPPSSFQKVLAVDTASFYDLAKEIINVKSFDAETALKSSSATFTALLNKALERNESSGSDTDDADKFAAASITLDFTPPFPLSLVLTENLMFQYRLIFRLQVLARFLTKFLGVTWGEMTHSSVWKYPKHQPRTKKWILRARILHHRMNDFVNELLFYMSHEVVEVAHTELQEFIHSTQKHFLQELLGTDIQTSDTAATNYNYSTLFDNQLTSKKESKVDVVGVTTRVGSYLNGILKDCLVTNAELVESIKMLFEVIIHYNTSLLRLRKSLIMISPELFASFSADYPDRFADKNMDDASVESRLDNLNSLLNSNFEIFNDSLTEFMARLREVGEVENKSILLLAERLERTFPDDDQMRD